MTLEFHPLANLFPLLEGAAFDELAASIKEHGQHDAIVLFEGKILDGRNRYRACAAAGVDALLEEFRGADAVAFVINKNIHRRHLNESQRAMIAARIMTLKQGQHAPKSNVEISTSVVTRDQAAALLNVHFTSVSAARKVLEEGTTEEIDSVQKGDAAVSTIAKAIRTGHSAEKRAKQRDEPLAAAGRNPERIQRLQVRAEIWGHVRDGLMNITSLPLPSEVVKIARAMDKAGLVDARLSKSINWLEEFAREWSNRDQSAA